jgi:hypothetical protein
LAEVEKSHERSGPARAGGGLELKHRGIEYTIVQGLSRQLWKWTVTIKGMTLRGHAATKSEAITDAERAIDRALAPKQLRLVPPDRE